MGEAPVDQRAGREPQLVRLQLAYPHVFVQREVLEVRHRRRMIRAIGPARALYFVFVVRLVVGPSRECAVLLDRAEESDPQPARHHPANQDVVAQHEVLAMKHRL